MAEFEAIQQRAIQMEQSKSSSINFYFIIVAAAIAAVPGMLSLVPDTMARPLLMAMLLFIFLAGIRTLENSVDQAINAVRLYRRAGRIRKYFHDVCQDIQGYLPFEASDAFPRINLPASLAYRGAEVTVFTVNVVSLSGVFGIAFSYLSVWLSLAIFVTFMCFSWVLQQRYFRGKLRRSEDVAKKRVYFPMNS